MNSFNLQQRTLLVAVLCLGAGLVLSGCQRRASEAVEIAQAPEAPVAIAAPSDAVDTEAPVIAEEQPVPPAAAPAPAAPVRQTAPEPAPAPRSEPAAAPVAPPVYEDPPPVAPAPPAPEPPRPVLVTVPTGTVLMVKLDQTLSSHTSQVGETFRSLITQDVAAEGRVAIPKGTVVLGRVTEAEPARKIGGRARLSLEFHSLRLASGETLPLQAVFSEAGKSQAAKDAAIIGGSTLGGLILGEAIDEGEGTKIGAIVGGLAGAAAAKRTKAKPVEVAAGSVLALETTQPLTVKLLP